MSTVRQDDLPQERSAATYKVFYDGQCEICQAGVSWLRVLDKAHKCDCVPITPEALHECHPELDLDACLQELHVVGPGGNLWVGWDAVARLARLSRSTWIVGAVGSIPPFRQLARILYRFVARNRYSLSKCRGGACQVSKPGLVRREATLGAFWSCYTIGLLARLPLVAWSTVGGGMHRTAVFARTYRRRLDLLDGKLSVLFLGGWLANAIPILFGELFTAILYKGVLIDPGSPRMRRSLARHLRRIPAGQIRDIVATHAHEEHVGNLNWAAGKTGAAIHISEQTAGLLRSPAPLPSVRAAMIGQPPPLKQPFEILGSELTAARVRFQIIPTPGHCDDHIAVYDPEEKLLLAGDTFMGTYFATPNPDVDSRKWLDTLERLSELDIEIMIEGHGHIHTLRSDVPDIPGVVIREHPKAAIAEKLRYMRWLREQVLSGFHEGLPIRAIEASCFPWARKSAWENFASDEMIRMLSLGHFSRTELVRSFVRNSQDAMPTVYQVRLYSAGREE
jgi:glyoxylase-like metal-dependent hydrolase (beta-lactamase superfamily II)/predicted DCC family thiol-disulfide oxidoreductase YuxK